LFDPFGDFDTAGYLRNVAGLKDPLEVAEVEHGFFLANLPKAALYLRKKSPITYADYLEVHKILFLEFYPWAGRDRLELGVGAFISKGGRVQFVKSDECRRAIEWGLGMGNDKDIMARRPGAVMGAFAWGHPFLDGNGRTMSVVHAELFHRAGFAIDWTSTTKAGYLDALTRELSDPEGGHVDAYFRTRIVATNKRRPWIQQLTQLPGLDGGEVDQTQIAYDAGDVVAQVEYESILQARRDSESTNKPR
jgi:cell filamentation protein